MKPSKTTTTVALTLLLAGVPHSQSGALSGVQSSAANAMPSDAGLAWADFDGDGLDDVFAIAPGGAGALLRNVGDGSFEDQSAGLASTELGAVAHAAWGDLDADGQPDLLLVDHYGATRLLLNGGGSSFLDVTAEAGLANRSRVIAARWADYDADALEDLVIVGVDGPRLFHNMGGYLEPVLLPVNGAEFVAVGPQVPPGSTTTAVTSTGSGLGARGSADAAPFSSGNATETSASSSLYTASPGGVAASGLACAVGLTDLTSGTCLSASSNPALGTLYPLSQEFFVDSAGSIGLGTTLPLAALHLDALGLGVGASALLGEDLIVDAPDSVIGLYSTGGGSWGSALALGEIDGDGALVDKWSIARLTSPVGSDLRFTYGSNPSYALNPAPLTLDSDGDVGIGTTNPVFPLHVIQNETDGPALRIETQSAGYTMVVDPGTDGTGPFFGGSSRFGYFGGLGLPVPTVELTTAADNEGLVNVFNVSGEAVVSLGADSTSGGYVRVERPDGGEAVLLDTSAGDGYLRMHNDQGVHTVQLDSGDSTNAGFLQLFDTNGVLRISLEAQDAGKGRITCDVLEITGGADLVESFDTREDAIEPGTVLVIDPEVPGELRTSTSAYDHKVAGVVSGAGGVDPGLAMGQHGVASGDTQVALTGRVFVKATAENGAIRAGDRLTTSSLAGHAMRATDAARTDGAVIGKAMSELDEGMGLVLVLVNLQ